MKHEESLLRYALLPVSLVAVLMVLLPLVDSLLVAWPLRPGELQWRFGAVGMFSQALLLPVMGVALLLATALSYGRRTPIRIMAVVSGLVALALLAVLPFFLLDFMQMRAQVRAEAKAAFDVATVFAIVKIGMFAVVALAMAFAGWKATRRAASGRKAAPAQNRADGLLVGSR